MKNDSDFRKDARQKNGLYPSCRVCVSKAAKKAYYSDPEKPRANSRRWAKTNKEYKRRKDRERYQSDKDRHKSRNEQWRLKNLTRVATSSRRWSKRNPEKRRAISASAAHRRRAEKSKSSISDLSVISKWEKSWRSKPEVTCFWCRGTVSSKSAHTDHITSLHRGGSHSIDNLCIACGPCNLKKSSRTLSSWNDRIKEPVLL